MKTFVVRVWAPPTAAEGELDQLRGIVEHLGSGDSQPFKDDTELLAFLHAQPRHREREHELGNGGAS